MFEKAKTGIAFYGETKKQAGIKLKQLTVLPHFEQLITLLQVFNLLANSDETEMLKARPVSTRIKKGGPALHVHHSQDEWWYVLEGEFLIKVGDQLYQAKAGDSVFGPRGVPHAFAKTNEGNARLLMTFQPAGKIIEFFIASSEGKLSKMPPTEQDDFRKQHGFERVGPALDYQKTP